MRSGFEAVPELMVGGATTLEDAGSALAALSDSLPDLPGGSVSVFGARGAADAYANFIARWTGELSTQVGALAELAGKIQASADNYDQLDQAGGPGNGETESGGESFGGAIGTLARIVLRHLSPGGADEEAQASDPDRLEELKATIEGTQGMLGTLHLKAAVEDALAAPAPADGWERLQQYAAIYATAARQADEVYRMVSAVTVRDLPEAWVSTASELAADVVSAVGKGIDDSSRVLDETSRELEVLGHDLGAARLRHERGRPPLSRARDLLADLGVMAVLKDQLDIGSGQDSDQLDAARAAAREGIENLLGAAVFADDACRRFTRQLNQYAAEATAGRLTGGDLTDADKIMLGEAAVPRASHDQTILSVVDMSRASAALGRLSPADRESMEALLARSKSPQESAYLLKALAAGHSVAEVARFGQLIHKYGKSPLWLRDRLSPASTQSSGEPGVRSKVYYDGSPWSQEDSPTCVAVATMLARARVDPVYALQLTTGGRPGDPEYDNGDAFAQRLRDEQDRVYEDGRLFFADWPVVAHKGVLPHGSRRLADSEIGAHTGSPYQTYYPLTADRRRDALTSIENSVDQGKPVAVGVGGNDPFRWHQMMIIGHEGDRLQIYNPKGFTVWVTEDDFVNGNMDIANPILGGPDRQRPDVRLVQLPR